MTDNDLIRRGDAKQCCTNELRNTAHLLSNPPQSSAAWDARNAIDAIPAVQPTVTPDVAALVDYVLQDDQLNRLTPRVMDIAYSAFMLGRCGKNTDDGGPCDWFTDTKPMVDAKIAEIRAALARVKEETK